MANSLKKQSEILEITAEAKTEAQAVEQIFQQVKKQAYQKCEGYLVEMHVDGFEIQSVQEKTIIKKYLYFFLPKEVKSLSVQARVMITISSIDRGFNAS